MARNHIGGSFWGVGYEDQFVQGLRQAMDAVTQKGIYVGDNLFTFGRNLSFLGDPDFVEAVADNNPGDVENSIMWRTAIACWAAHSGLRRAGDFVECGTYKGFTAGVICDYLKFDGVDKRFFLYDLFEHSPEMDHHGLPEHGPDLYERVVGRFSAYENVRVVKGAIPGSFSQALPETVAFLHIDLNEAAAEVAALEHLFDRVIDGGIVLLDDYGWLPYKEQKEAEDLFFDERDYRVVELPTGQGMVIR